MPARQARVIATTGGRQNSLSSALGAALEAAEAYVRLSHRSGGSRTRAAAEVRRRHYAVED
jgi:hypothetical protein